MRGHIERRGTKWRLTIDQGRDPITGKRRRASITTDTKREAEERARELTGKSVGTNARTVGQLVDAWWAHVRDDLSPATQKGYESKIEQYLRPAFGNLPVRDLTTARIDELYKAMRTRKGARGWKLSVSTVRRTHAVLSGACAQGVKWGWIPTNPCTNATTGRSTRREIDPPDIEEIRRVLDAATSEIGDFVQLALATGARRGELAGLQWADIDLEAPSITFRRSVADRKGGTIVVGVHRKSATRTVSIDPVTVAALKARRIRIGERALVFGATITDDCYVLAESTPLTEPLRPQIITGRWRDAAQVAGSKARFHDLRHFHVTQLLAAGVPVAQVAKRVGHSSASRLTLDVYAHAIEKLDKRAAEVIAAAIEG